MKTEARVFEMTSQMKQKKICSDTFFYYCPPQMKGQQFMQRCNIPILRNITSTCMPMSEDRDARLRELKTVYGERRLVVN